VLDVINAELAFTIGGSADLTPSNNTRTRGLKEVTPDDFSGRYLHYGIREMGMAAAMNGLATHGGFAPAGGTFLCFTDYARGAIRISALSHAPVVYIMTHDSIGLGEDGPTHQPVEHLAALRAMPNLRVFRPADTVETAECWQLALEKTTGPTILALSRQALTPVRLTTSAENLCGHGGYELVAAKGEAKVSLYASGSEVEIAVAAQKQLAERGIATRVVSVPSLDLLLEQPVAPRKAIIGNAPVKIAIEAAVRLGWDAVIGPDGVFIGMTGFGASAPAKDLYPHFGITAEAVVAAATKGLQGA
jgi:transketolase